MASDALRNGATEYQNTRFIYETIDACSTLINILAQNMDDFPNMKYDELYRTTQTLIELKWSACELLGIMRS